LLSDLKIFLTKYNYAEYSRTLFALLPSKGRIYEIVFYNKNIS